MSNKLNNISTIIFLLSMIFIFTFSTCKKDKMTLKKAVVQIECTGSTVAKSSFKYVLAMIIEISFLSKIFLSLFQVPKRNTPRLKNH